MRGKLTQLHSENVLVEIKTLLGVLDAEHGVVCSYSEREVSLSNR